MGNVKVLLDARAFRGAVCRCVRQEKPSNACCLSHLASLPLSTDADGYFPYLVFVPRLIDCNFANPFCFAHFEIRVDLETYCLAWFRSFNSRLVTPLAA